MEIQDSKYGFRSISRINNINAIRYYLAICILMNHFCILTDIRVLQLPRIFGGAGSFFAISGFLMFPSFAKNSDIKRFLKRRGKRIFPPYFAIVLVAAVACVFLSSLSPTEYFASPGFWKYLVANLGFMNFVAPDLPGVFTTATNTYSAVNGSLWTMKGEVACYLTVPLIFSMVRRHDLSMTKVLGWLMAVFGAAYLVLVALEFDGHPSYDIPARQCLVMFLFYMGGILNQKLDIIHKYAKIIIPVLGIYLLADYCIDSFYHYNFISKIIAHHLVGPFATGLMVISCAVTGTWGKRLANHTALTYEIYLFHYPVIQTFITLGLIERLGFYTSLIAVIAIVAVMAILSHRYIDGWLMDKLSHIQLKDLRYNKQQ